MSMIQGSESWHEHRAKHFNASEAGTVMAVNPWKPRNPPELFDLKTGAFEVEETMPMRRGTELEPEARAALESLTGISFTPTVMTKGRYSASLDGLDFDGEVACEIKCPMRTDSKALQCVTPADIRERIPHYWWQMVHQQYVSGVREIIFYAYHPKHESETFVRIPADALVADRDALIGAWEEFGSYLDANERPDDGAAEDESDEMAELAEVYRIAKDEAAAAARAEKDAKAALVQRAQEKGVSKLSGAGVTVQCSERKGAVDYGKIPELKGVDLDFYRKKPTTVWSVK